MVADAADHDAESENTSAVLRLAAVRSALDQRRQAWRSDILLTAIIEVLALHGERTVQMIARSLAATWGTRAVTESMIRDALKVAEEAHVVAPRERIDGQCAWVLAESVKRETEEDREWVRQAFETFANELHDRVVHDFQVDVAGEKAGQLASHMFAALATGAEGSFAPTDDPALGGLLRPNTVCADDVRQYLLDKVQPRDLAQALADVSVTVLDPHDPLGNEILHLLVVGNMLHGLLGGRDLAGKIDLARFRIALDTSALVPLVEHETEAKGLIEELVSRSAQAGVDVIVAEHTLDEWERLWQGADNEVRGARGTELRASAGLYLFVSNPLVRAYLEAVQDNERLSWERFQIGRRDLRARLATLGVTIRPHGNNRDQDLELATSIASRLRDYSAEEDVRGRTAAAAEADGHTAAMVTRWRASSKSGLPVGWMIARDSLTGRAYRVVVPDDPYPVIMSVDAWMMFLSSVLCDEPETVSQLVQTLSTAATRDAFLGTATALSLDEVTEMAAILTEPESGAYSRADLRDLVCLDVSELVENSREPRSGRHRELAIEAVRRRSHRRDIRARRHQAQSERREQEVQERFVSAVTEAEQRGRIDATGELRPQLDNLQADMARQKKLSGRVTVSAVSVVLILAAAAVVGIVVGPGWWMAGVPLGLAGTGGVLYEWCTDDDRAVGWLLLAILATAATTGLGAMVSVWIASLVASG